MFTKSEKNSKWHIDQGCRITENIAIKGFNALILENGKIKVTVLLDKGSDIYEFIYKPLDLDLMWHFRDLDDLYSHPSLPSSEKTMFLDWYVYGRRYSQMPVRIVNIKERICPCTGSFISLNGIILSS